MELTPIWLSLKLALLTTIILLIIGLPLAYWLSKRSSFLKLIVETLITMPLVLPPSVLGFYLLLLFSPQNALGNWLQTYFNLRLVFSFEGLILGSICYSIPFMISPLKSALSHLHPSLKEAAFTMGKTPFQTLYFVLLPNIKSSIYTAIVLTFAHTLGEFGVVLMIGGNIPDVTKVASIAIYDAAENLNYELAGNYSLILFLISFLMMVCLFLLNNKSDKLS